MTFKKKKLKDCSYRDFVNYTNYQAGAGRWSFGDAIISIEIRKVVDEGAKKKFFPWVRRKEEDFLFQQQILEKKIGNAEIEWEE